MHILIVKQKYTTIPMDGGYATDVNVKLLIKKVVIRIENEEKIETKIHLVLLMAKFRKVSITLSAKTTSLTNIKRISVPKRKPSSKVKNFFLKVQRILSVISLFINHYLTLNRKRKQTLFACICADVFFFFLLFNRIGRRHRQAAKVSNRRRKQMKEKYRQRACNGCPIYPLFV